MKTIEWLRSQLEDGDVLTQEVVGEWLASYNYRTQRITPLFVGSLYLLSSLL